MALDNHRGFLLIPNKRLGRGAVPDAMRDSRRSNYRYGDYFSGARDPLLAAQSVIREIR
jgi:hypothetical protein